MSGDRMSVDEFIRWSTAQPDRRRWELHDGRRMRRSGSWLPDRIAKMEMMVQLHVGLMHDARHQVSGMGPLVVAGPRTALEQHLVVFPRPGTDPDDDVVREPIAVLETIRADGQAGYWPPRLAAYARLPTVRHVLAVHPTARPAIHLRREAADGSVAARLVRGGAVPLAPAAAVIDLHQIRAELDPPAGGAARAEPPAAGAARGPPPTSARRGCASTRRSDATLHSSLPDQSLNLRRVPPRQSARGSSRGAGRP